MQCPSGDLVGCTSPDPLKPIDECSTVGEECLNANEGEFCCLDGCTRKYCTAKGVIPDTTVSKAIANSASEKRAIVGYGVTLTVSLIVSFVF